MVESRGLVASSAPFPNTKGSSWMSPQSSSAGDEDTAEDAHSDKSDEHPTLSLPISLGQLQNKLEAHEQTTEILYTPTSEDLSLAGSEPLNKANNMTTEYFYEQDARYTGQDESHERTPNAPSLRFPRHNIFSSGATESQYGSDQDLEYLSHSSPGATSARSPSAEVDLNMRSPDALDIASRRSRRPPPLAIGGSRSFTGNGPRTAIDLAGRTELGREMRRVASANGSVRVSKPVSAPRSPFHDKRTETLFHLNRSPVMTATKGGVAPPTPDTPIVANHPNNDTLTGNAVSAGSKVQTASFVTHDPTLRTPPSTPGIGENFFSLNSAYNMSIPDQPLVSSGLSNFSGGFDVASLPMTASQYMTAPASNSSSQTGSSSFTAPLGSAYYGYSGSNAEYQWPSSAANRASPDQHNVQFMNMTTTNFD